MKLKRKSKLTNGAKDPDYRGIGALIKPVGSFKPEVKVVLYGAAGTGKTTLAGTFPKPLLLVDIGEKGTDSIRNVKGVDVLRATDWEQLEQVYWYLKKGDGRKYKTVVFDTMSQAQDLCIKMVMADAGKEPEEGDVGGWGTMTRKHWGIVSSRIKSFITNTRDLDLNVIYVAHDRAFNVEDEDDNDGAIAPSIGPRLMPSVASTLNAAVGVIGNTFIREYKRKIKLGKNKTKEKRFVEYGLRIGPHGYYVTKIRKPRDVEPPATIFDPSYDKILAIMEGEEE
jgi:hypothetical protein